MLINLYFVHDLDFAAAQYRQYQRLTKQMKPSTDEYKKEKEQK